MDNHEFFSHQRPINSESDQVVGYLDLLREDLHAKRYNPQTIRQYVTAARAFFCWLANHNLVASDVNKETVRLYVGSLKRVATSSAHKLRLPHTGVGLKHLLETLYTGRVEEPPKVFVLSWIAFQKCRFTYFFGFWPQSVGVYGLFVKITRVLFLLSICTVLSYLRLANLKNTTQNEHFWGFFHATRSSWLD